MAKISADDFFNTETKSSSVKKISADDFFSSSTKEFEQIEQQWISNGSKDILSNTLNSVIPVITPVSTNTKSVDFKADQAKKQSSPLQGKLPAAELIQTNQGIQQTLQGKVPAANLVQQTGRGPENASQIPGVSEYEIRKQAIEESNAPEAVKAYSNIMNYAAFGNPIGQAVSRSFAGNSGATRRDSTGNAVVDKVTDVVNDLVTPFITPTGAPVGQGIIGSTYGATEKALSGKVGHKILGAAEKVIPGSQNVARVAATEGIAGGLQGVGFGLQQGQDSGSEIGRNAALGAAAGGVLGGVGAALGEAFPALLNMFRKSGIADDEIAEIAPELLALPEAQPRTMRKQLAGEIKTSSNTDPIVNPYTFKLDEASPQTQRSASNAAEGRTAVRDIDNQISELTNSYEQAVIDEYKVLKEQRDNPQGVNQGQLFTDAEGNVIGRQGRLSNNPRWYQEAMKENNYQKLSNKKLYELARKHVDEGFDTEAGRAPGWRQENNYDEQLQALQQVRETLLNSVKEIDPSLYVTDAPLKTDVLKNLRRESKTVSAPKIQVKAETNPKQSVKNEVPEIRKTKSEIEKLDEEFKAYKELRERQVAAGYLDREQASKQIKGRAMEIAAQKREIIQGDSLIPVEGGLTAKELQSKISRLELNYKGKEVIAGGRKGKIKGNSFGRVVVEFSDGTTKSFDPSDVVPKNDIKQEIARQTKVNTQITRQPKTEVKTVTREQELMNKVNAKQPLTQEDIDFAMSSEFDQSKLFPESTPTESTYVKPRQAEPVKAKVETKPAVEAKPAVKTKTIVTEAKKEIKTSVTKKATPGERGFYRTLKNSGKADEAVARMNPNYERISNQTSLAGANERVKDLNKATSDVLSRKLKSAEDGATALRLVQEYTKMGDHETAALISGKAAEDFTEAGQLIQAASMWNRLSPEGMLLRVQREISKVNEVLGPAEEKLSLSAADAAKITKTGESIQSVQKVRDLSQEVLDMVSGKKPGETLTADEQKLLVEFENQVKSVNKSVKPFLKTAKSDAEKIAKIKPENRTRDQVVQYLDQKAAEALARRQKARNIGIVAELNNPVIDYSIIAAAKIARGVRTFSDLTEDMVKTVGSDYKKYADEVFTKATQRFRREHGLPTTTELEKVIRNASKDFDEASKNALRRMAAEIGYFTDENLKRELTQDLQQVIKTYGRSTLGEKIAGVQTASQLLSVPTFLRNTLGNAGQFGLEKINKVAALPIDWTLSKFTGQRTIQFRTMNQEKLWKNFASGTSSGWREVNAMGTLDSYNVKPSVFSDKNPLKYLTKLTGASLQGMDYAAYKAAYGDVMATYAEQLGRSQGMTRKQIKANMPELLTKLDDTVRALADQAGLYATYQDETMLSRAAQGTKRALNAVSDKVSKAAVEKGLIPRSLSLEGFGLGDVVLKYAKTPANLVMRGIDYSPLGFIRAIGEFMPLMKNGGKNFNQFNATRAISRAITGTVGLTAVGYAMADAGLLTGASSSDADKRSIEEQSGQGAYKANLSGIYRWIMSGFDKNEAKYQKGDKLIDYAWLQPAAISLGMGVNFRLAQDAKKPGEDVSNVELAKRSIIGGLRTVLENPMVTGLSDVVGGVSDLITRQDTKKLTGIVKGIPSSFVPAVLGQARNATDNKQRVTYDKSVLKEMLNLVKNRVPGLSKQLPVSYDSLGNERQRIQGGKENSIGQYLNSFLNPTKVTTFDVSPEAKTILDILNDSNDSSVLPRVIQKYVTFTNEDGRKERYTLSNDEYSKLQQKTGQRVIEEIQYEQDYLSDTSVDIEDRADILKKILEDVGRETRDEFKEEKGLVND